MKDEGPELKIPHMGWNNVKKEKETRFLKDIEDGTFFISFTPTTAPRDKTVTLPLRPTERNSQAVSKRITWWRASSILKRARGRTQSP